MVAELIDTILGAMPGPFGSFARKFDVIWMAEICRVLYITSSEPLEPNPMCLTKKSDQTLGQPCFSSGSRDVHFCERPHLPLLPLHVWPDCTFSRRHHLPTPRHPPSFTVACSPSPSLSTVRLNLKASKHYNLMYTEVRRIEHRLLAKFTLRPLNI